MILESGGAVVTGHSIAAPTEFRSIEAPAAPLPIRRKGGNRRIIKTLHPVAARYTIGRTMPRNIVLTNRHLACVAVRIHSATRETSEEL
jgi:hypothetical protein